jgi:hypothetical protein
MPARKRTGFLLLITALMVCGVLAGFSGCSGAAGATNKLGSAGGSDAINISVRNATWQGGWAAFVGQQLKDDGYCIANGYTIDIGNTAYRATQKSMIIVQGKNDRLQSEAEKLQRILGFEIDYLDGFINPCNVVNSDNSPSSSVFIVLGERDVGKTNYDQYESEVNAYDYPPIMGHDTHTIVQIEPYQKQDS